MKRYIIAFTLSSLGILGSVFFLKPDYSAPVNNEKRKPVATIHYSKNTGVQKMPQGSAFWIDLSNKSELYEGDSIRTDAETSAQIKFIGSETSLKIQPETRFLVKKKGKKFVVGDVEGNLFVENAKATSDIQIQAGGQTIDVTGGKAKININKGEVDLALQGGKATTNIGGKNVKLEGNQAAKITANGLTKKKVNFVNVYPEFDQKLYLKKESKSVTFSWDKLKSSFHFKLKIGKGPKKLFSLAPKDILATTKESITANIPRGEHYWQIIATSKKNPKKKIASDVYKFNLKTLYPPVASSPLNEQALKFKKNKEDKVVKLKWKSPSPISSSYVEIAKDESFTQVVHTEETKNTFLNYPAKEGTFYWKVTTNFKGSSDFLKSKVNKYSVQFFNTIFPPKLIYPALQENILLQEKALNTDITLSWERLNIAKKYRLYLENNNKRRPYRFDKDITDPTFDIKKLPQGQYKWKVATIDSEGNVSAFSRPRYFTIKKPTSIKWLKRNDLFEYIQRPEIEMTWSKDTGVKKWRIEYSKNQNFNNAISSILSSPKTKLSIKEDGNYFVKVYALNEDDKVVSSSSVRSIMVKEKPLPSKPSFIKKDQNRFIASTEGKVPLKFSPLKDSKDRIVVKIKDQNGEVIRMHRMRKNQDMLSGLMPGRYYFNAYTEDQYERKSLPTESKELIVPEKSNIQAPLIENIIIR